MFVVKLEISSSFNSFLILIMHFIHFQIYITDNIFNN